MQNLSKENFWNSLNEKYPLAVKYFCDWIDRYKVEVGWQKLFVDGIKFHDIPFEMQNGILARFDLEMFNNIGNKGRENYERIAGSFRQQYTNLFEDLQRQIEIRNSSIN